MIEGFRTKIGNYILKRRSAAVTRHRQMVNLPNAKLIGIVYMLDEVSDYEQVQSFVASLQHEHKEVHALGFVQHKKLINRFLPKLSYDFFSFNNLDWFYRPVNEKVRNFISTEFDLLIDLTMKESLPLKFVVGLSVARCKVGGFSEDDTRYHDLMIKIQAMGSLREFISQVNHYLTIIDTNGEQR